jgi:hypothetical protein
MNKPYFPFKISKSQKEGSVIKNSYDLQHNEILEVSSLAIMGLLPAISRISAGDWTF